MLWFALLGSLVNLGWFRTPSALLEKSHLAACCCGKEVRRPSLLPGSCFSYAGILWRESLWIVLLNLNFCFANVMRASGVYWWGKGVRGVESQQSIPTLSVPVVQSMERMGPWKTSLLSPVRGHKIWPALPGSVERTAPIPRHCLLGTAARWGGVFADFWWPPLVFCMDVRSAEAEHIPVINMTKNQPGITQAVPGMVWAFL